MDRAVGEEPVGSAGVQAPVMVRVAGVVETAGAVGRGAGAGAAVGKEAIVDGRQGGVVGRPGPPAPVERRDRRGRTLAHEERVAGAVDDVLWLDVAAAEDDA